MKTAVSVEEFNILNDKLRDKTEEVSILSSKVRNIYMYGLFVFWKRQCANNL